MRFKLWPFDESLYEMARESELCREVHEIFKTIREQLEKKENK